MENFRDETVFESSKKILAIYSICLPIKIKFLHLSVWGVWFFSADMCNFVGLKKSISFVGLNQSISVCFSWTGEDNKKKKTHKNIAIETIL